MSTDGVNPNQVVDVVPTFKYVPPRIDEDRFQASVPSLEPEISEGIATHRQMSASIV
jgi:hypothetical protein